MQPLNKNRNTSTEPNTKLTIAKQSNKSDTELKEIDQRIQRLKIQSNPRAGKPRQKELCALLQQAKNSEELLLLWKIHKPFSPQNICTFLNRLYKHAKNKTAETLLSTAQKAAFYEVLQLAEQTIASFDIRGLSLLSNALYHLKPTTNTSLIHAITAHLLKNDAHILESASITDCALLAYAAPLFTVELHTVLNAIEKKLLGDTTLSQAQPRELSYIAIGFSRAKTTPIALY